MRKRLENPEKKDKNLRNVKKRLEKAEAKEKKIQNVKRRLENLEIKEKNLERAKKRLENPEIKERKNEKYKQRLSDIRADNDLRKIRSAKKRECNKRKNIKGNMKTALLERYEKAIKLGPIEVCKVCGQLF